MELTITNITGAVYANAANTAINCTIVTEEKGNLPFTASSYDPEPHGVNIFNSLVAGTYGAIAPFVGG
jgi:hypothetical protein